MAQPILQAAAAQHPLFESFDGLAPLQPFTRLCGPSFGGRARSPRSASSARRTSRAPQSLSEGAMTKNRLARNDAPLDVGDFATPFSLSDPCAPTRRRLLQGMGGGVGLAVASSVTSILQPPLSAAAQSQPSTDRLIRTFVGHVGVTSVAFSPDGRAILSGGADSHFYGVADKRLKLWEVATGKELRTFKGRSNIVQAVAFSPDSHTALSGSDDNTLKLWDVASGQQLRSFTADTISSVALSPDGRAALSGGGRTLKLWEVASGQELRTFTSTGPSGLVQSVAFSPDGRTALSGSA